MVVLGLWQAVFSDGYAMEAKRAYSRVGETYCVGIVWQAWDGYGYGDEAKSLFANPIKSCDCVHGRSRMNTVPRQSRLIRLSSLGVWGSRV